MPLSGLLPNTAPCLTTAEAIIVFDAQAVADCCEAMSNPFAAQLTEVLERAKSELAHVPAADTVVDAAEAEFATLREQADKAIWKVVKELRFFLDEKDDASQCRLMRRYGVKFLSGQTTTAE